MKISFTLSTINSRRPYINNNKGNYFKNTFSFLWITILILKSQITSQTQISGCEDDYFLCNNFKCSKYSYCFYNSNDINSLNNKQYSAECVCMSGYDTNYSNFTSIYNNYSTNHSNIDITRCCYKLKELYYAFILECFLGFGLGYLYIENYNLFVLKFIFQSCICCIICFSGYCLNIDNGNNSNSMNNKRKNKQINSLFFFICNILNFILIAIFVIWKIVDFFLFGLNMVKDANGMPLNNLW